MRDRPPAALGPGYLRSMLDGERLPQIHEAHRKAHSQFHIEPVRFSTTSRLLGEIDPMEVLSHLQPLLHKLSTSLPVHAT